jgi:hypothetical protein
VASPGEAATPTTQPTTATTQVATTARRARPRRRPPSTQAAPQISRAAPATSARATRVVSAATQPSVVTLGADKAFPLLVNVSSQGAGLDSVTLKGFDAPPDVAHEHPGKSAKESSKEPYVFQRRSNPTTASRVRWRRGRSR